MRYGHHHSYKYSVSRNIGWKHPSNPAVDCYWKDRSLGFSVKLGWPTNTTPPYRRACINIFSQYLKMLIA